MHNQNTHAHVGRQEKSVDRSDISSDGAFIVRKSMTFRNVVAASVRRNRSPSEFITLLELVARGQRDGRECRPSQVTLARDGRMTRPAVRRALAALVASGAIISEGGGERGVAVWRAQLPDTIPQYVNHRMVLRAFQHSRLKPVQRAVLIAIASAADDNGRTNGHCPMSEDLQGWFHISADTVGRTLKTLVRLGLLSQVRRAGGGAFDSAQYDVTFCDAAMIWVPGAGLAHDNVLPMCSANPTGCAPQIRPRVIRKSDHNHSQRITVSHHGQARDLRALPDGEDHQRSVSASPSTPAVAIAPQEAIELKTASSPVAKPERARCADDPQVEPNEASLALEATVTQAAGRGAKVRGVARVRCGPRLIWTRAQRADLELEREDAQARANAERQVIALGCDLDEFRREAVRAARRRLGTGRPLGVTKPWLLAA